MPVVRTRAQHVLRARQVVVLAEVLAALPEVDGRIVELELGRAFDRLLHAAILEERLSGADVVGVTVGRHRLNGLAGGLGGLALEVDLQALHAVYHRRRAANRFARQIITNLEGGSGTE